MATRLWIRWNHSDARITLTEDKPVTLYHSSPTDEGWHSEGCTYWLENGIVYADHYTDGRDCDGRLSTEYHTRRLTDGTWELLNRSQRDYTAEAAGY